MSKKTSSNELASSPIKSIFDFPERLSPMLVKELRQGLRSISYTALFLTLQAVLLILLLFMIGFGDNSGGNPYYISITIFIIYAMAVCGVQPLRGLNAISSEVNGNTIDLVVLTRLTAWKIVFGKWVSLMGQTLIFTVSLFPYLILRYFLGGMLLLEEITIFYCIFIAAAGLTALTVGLSAIRLAVIRFIISGGLCITGAIYALIVPVLVTLMRNEGFGFGGSNIEWTFYLYVALTSTLVIAYLCWMFLDFGASMIAPVSENRATPRRLVYLCALTIGTLIYAYFGMQSSGFHSAGPDPEDFQILIIFILGCLFVPFYIITITEHSYLSPRIIRSLTEHRWLSNFRYLLYPGWASGAIFLSGCAVVQLAMILFLDHYDDDEIALVITASLGALMFPAALTFVFAKNAKNLLSVYLICLVGTGILTTLVSILSEITAEELSLLFFWNPSTAFYIFEENVVRSDELTVIVNTLFILLYGSIIHVKSGNVFLQIRKQERQISASTQEASTTTEPSHV